MIEPAKRIVAIEESPTLAVMARAKALKAEGRDVVGFTVGEPDFDTPENIKSAAVSAIEAGRTKYTPVGGIPELKKAIIEKFERDNKVAYSPEEILVSCGGKHSIYNLFHALLNPGDEVIVPAPYWVSYPPIVELAGGVPVIAPTGEENGFKLTPADLAGHITAKTRAVIINSPSNPTGSAYTASELEAIVEVALDKDILVVSDEIYERLVYDGFDFTSVATLSTRAKEGSVILNGVSKTYSMTGWRIGYAAGPAALIKAMAKIQSQSTSNPTSISQWASLEALSGPQDAVDNMLKEFAKRRTLMIDGLNAIEGVTALTPEGAFYAFPNVSSFFGKKDGERLINGSADMAEYLLDTVELAVVPGVAFGSDANLRFSYACSAKVIEEGLKRLATALSRLK